MPITFPPSPRVSRALLSAIVPRVHSHWAEGGFLTPQTHLPPSPILTPIPTEMRTRPGTYQQVKPSPSGQKARGSISIPKMMVVRVPQYPRGNFPLQAFPFHSSLRTYRSWSPSSSLFQKSREEQGLAQGHRQGQMSKALDIYHVPGFVLGSGWQERTVQMLPLLVECSVEWW